MLEEDLEKLKKKYSINEKDFNAISASYYEEKDSFQYEIKALKNKIVLYEKCIKIFKSSNNSINQIISQIFDEGE